MDNSLRIKKGNSIKELQIPNYCVNFVFITANMREGMWERALKLRRSTTDLVVYRNGKSIKRVLCGLLSPASEGVVEGGWGWSQTRSTTASFGFMTRGSQAL